MREGYRTRGNRALIMRGSNRRGMRPLNTRECAVGVLGDERGDFHVAGLVRTADAEVAEDSHQRGITGSAKIERPVEKREDEHCDMHARNVRSPPLSLSSNSSGTSLF